MKRKLKDIISWTAIQHLAYIPSIILKIRNWIDFTLDYILLREPKQAYRFRNNIIIKTAEPADSATIAVIFFKKDYGSVKDNSVIIDIGANIGVYSIFAAASSKNTKVYAFEPMPKIFGLLSENIEINSLQEKIIPFNLGVGSAKEKRRLFLTGSSPFNSIYSRNNNNKEFVEISCLTLKDIFEENKIEKCDILKIDCEGAEFEILYNTPQEYFDKISEIRMEYHDLNQEEYNIQRLIEFLKNKGFKLGMIRKDTSNTGIAWFIQTSSPIKFI